MEPVTSGSNYQSILTTHMKEVTLHEADGDSQKGAILREVRSESDAPESSSCGNDVQPPESGLLSERSKARNMSDHENCSTLKDAEKFLEFHHSMERDLLKEEMTMELDKEHSLSHYIEQLSRQIQSRRQKLKEMESQWDGSKKPLEDQRLFLLESLCATNPEAEIKLQKLKEVESETLTVISEIRRREKEGVCLALDLAKHPKAASRRSYIQRIAEITKNSRKLDADIEHILKETRELKLESNSIEERLYRTYAVVDETVFREAKKDPIGGQAHKLLRSIHESLEDIRVKVLATDKAQREVAELEAKISKFDSRSLNIDDIQLALDALRRENELLEKAMQS